MRTKPFLFILACLLMNISFLDAQTVSFELKTTPSVDFTFNTIAKYQNGIIIPDVVTLNIVATGTQWDLYAGSITATAGTWDNTQYYCATGDGFPPVDILQVAFRNSSSTSLITGYVPMQDLATTNLNFIGDHNLAPDSPINCTDVNHKGTNTAGTYLTDPQCYQFKVDFRIVPGLNYRAGSYNLTVEIIIAPDL
jgi:hypothetical protein